MAGRPAVPLVPQVALFTVLGGRGLLVEWGRSLPREPAGSGNQEEMLPVARAVSPTRSGTRGSLTQNPSDPGRGRSSTKDLNPPTPALAGGLHGSGDPQDPPAWGGSRGPPPPESVGSPPTPSAVCLHAACTPVGRLGAKHLTDPGGNQPSGAARPLDCGGSRCVTAQVWG